MVENISADGSVPQDPLTEKMQIATATGDLDFYSTDFCDLFTYHKIINIADEEKSLPRRWSFVP